MMSFCSRCGKPTTEADIDYEYETSYKMRPYGLCIDCRDYIMEAQEEEKCAWEELLDDDDDD